MHDGNLSGSLVTSVSMCSGQAYHVKALHNMLPTATRLLVTCPDLYHDDLCPCCLQVSESNAHLWQCPSSGDSIRRMVIEGSNLFWSLASQAQGGSRLSELTIFPGPHSVLHVVQGIVPLEWATILHSCGLSAKKVRVIARRVGKYFVGAGHDSIWRPRCEAQISQIGRAHV